MKVKVTFNQQQYQLIKRLLEEEKYGKTDAEVVRSILREFLDLEKRIPYA